MAEIRLDPLPGSLTDAAAAVRRRELSARELVESQLRRIEAADPALSCFVELSAERALERADALDGSAGPIGPLHGVPLTVKDNVEVAGFPTTAGSPLLGTTPAVRDAAAVGRLRDAGAIVLGKTSMYELAFGAQNERWPAPGNPWRLDRSTAGSSSGSAAAVAARLGFASLASDTGGSIRVPAAFCGLVGLRPTPGRIPRDGLVPLSRLDELGPITQTAADAAVVFGVLAGAPEPLLARADGTRLALYDLSEVGPEVAHAIEQLAALLHAHGARPVGPPELDLAGASAALWAIAAADAAAHWLDRVRAAEHLVHPLVRDRILAGSELGARQLESACATRDRIAAAARRMFGRLDALILPAATCVSYPLGARLVETRRGTEEVSAAVTRYTPFATVAGLPSLAVPCGFDAEGMPIGAQLIAAPGNEALLFALARTYQAVSSWHERVPGAAAEPERRSNRGS